MRILLLNDFAEKSGGAETFFYNLKDLLKEKGREVETFFSASKPKVSIFGGVFSIKNLIESYKKIKEFNSDIMHIHKYNLSLSVSPLIAAKLLRKKTIVTFHDFGTLCANGWCVDKAGKPCDNPTSIKWVFKKSLSNKGFIDKLYDYIKNKVHIFLMKKFVDIYIGPSEAMTNYLRKIFNNKKVKHLPYFINDDWKFEDKKRINKKILFIGRLEREKGLEYLIKALKYLKPDISLDIIGKGPEEEKIRKLIKRLNIKNKVNFMGEVSNKDIRKHYYDSDVLIMPSVWMEQFGIVGLEAIASGTPVIASDMGGIRDWLKDKENGFLVPTRSPKKIAEAIKKIFSNKKLIETFSKYGRKLFEHNFTKEKHYKKLVEIYSL